MLTNLVATNLRIVRQQRGFSQGRLALLLRGRYGIHWHQTRICLLERGLPIRRPADLAELAAVLCVSPALLTGPPLVNLDASDQTLPPAA